MRVAHSHLIPRSVGLRKGWFFFVHWFEEIIFTARLWWLRMRMTCCDWHSIEQKSLSRVDYHTTIFAFQSRIRPHELITIKNLVWRVDHFFFLIFLLNFSLLTIRWHLGSVKLFVEGDCDAINFPCSMTANTSFSSRRVNETERDLNLRTPTLASDAGIRDRQCLTIRRHLGKLDIVFSSSSSGILDFERRNVCRGP
jgi:hypothetical protein